METEAGSTVGLCPDPWTPILMLLLPRSPIQLGPLSEWPRVWVLGGFLVLKVV